MTRVLNEFCIQNDHAISEIIEVLASCFLGGGKVLICGNGGSAADAQHIAAEFVCSFSKNVNRKGLPAISLTTDTSIITAYSNDFQFEAVFSRQLEALAREGDVLIILSTSGNSENCIRAAHMARTIGLKIVSFLGQSGELKNLSHYSLSVPSEDTQIIQQCHIVAYHTLVEMLEEKMFGRIN